MIRKLGTKRKNSSRPTFKICQECEEYWYKDKNLNCYEFCGKLHSCGVSENA